MPPLAGCQPPGLLDDPLENVGLIERAGHRSASLVQCLERRSTLLQPLIQLRVMDGYRCLVGEVLDTGKLIASEMVRRTKMYEHHPNALGAPLERDGDAQDD